MGDMDMETMLKEELDEYRAAYRLDPDRNAYDLVLTLRQLWRYREDAYASQEAFAYALEAVERCKQQYTKYPDDALWVEELAGSLSDRSISSYHLDSHDQVVMLEEEAVMLELFYLLEPKKWYRHLCVTLFVLLGALSRAKPDLATDDVKNKIRKLQARWPELAEFGWDLDAF